MMTTEKKAQGVVEICEKPASRASALDERGRSERTKWIFILRYFAHPWKWWLAARDAGRKEAEEVLVVLIVPCQWMECSLAARSSATRAERTLNNSLLSQLGWSGELSSKTGD
jgi:hypothetical protein